MADARIALGAVGPHPFRARARRGHRRRDDARPGRSSPRRPRPPAEECEPFTDAIATDWYRRRMVGVHVGRALERLAVHGTGEDR